LFQEQLEFKIYPCGMNQNSWMEKGFFFICNTQKHQTFFHPHEWYKWASSSGFATWMTSYYFQSFAWEYAIFMK
jgi:hypothetical protein